MFLTSGVSACTANGVAKKCAFPFRYKGVRYTKCTRKDASKPWCSTKTDAKGNHVQGRHPISKASLQHSQTIIQPCGWFMNEPSPLSVGQTPQTLPNLLHHGETTYRAGRLVIRKVLKTRIWGVPRPAWAVENDRNPNFHYLPKPNILHFQNAEYSA